MGIKEQILKKSNSYKFYKENYEKLHKLERQNKKLKRERKNLKGKLKSDENLIRFLFGDIAYSDDLPNYCPICGTVTVFNPFGNPPRPNAVCPVCGSLERVRFTNVYMKYRLQHVFDNPCRVLHFAPERAFYDYFRNNKNVDYYPVDINPDFYKAMNIDIRDKVNMEEIPYEDNYFDLIYNSHVLEHVPDDLKAMRELYRVLKDDGTCLVAVPLFDIPETLQNDEYNTPELRLKYYGQEDHLRKYGNDFTEKLKSAGFEVEELMPKDLVSDIGKRKVLGLLEGEKLFICKK